MSESFTVNNRPCYLEITDSDTESQKPPSLISQSRPCTSTTPHTSLSKVLTITYHCCQVRRPIHSHQRIPIETILTLNPPLQDDNQLSATIWYAKHKRGGVLHPKSLYVVAQESVKLKDLVGQISRYLEAHVLPGRPRRLRVIVNPYGGAGKALRHYTQIVEPLLRLTGVHFETLSTEYAGHALEEVSRLELGAWDGLLAVGGDGILNECVHALALRREANEFDRCPLPVGLVPAGSTNCINDTTSGVVDPTTACLHVLMGDTVGLDVILLRDRQGRLASVAFCSVAYGFFGDLLVRSERMRRCGPVRYTLGAVQTFLCLNSYNVQVDYSRASVSHCDVTDSSSKCRRGCEICARSREIPLSRPSSPQVQDAPGGNTEDGVSIKEKFAFVQVVPNRCKCKQSIVGVSPNAHLGDGTMDVIFARPTSFPRLAALRMLAIHSTSMDRFAPSFIEGHRVGHVDIDVTNALGGDSKENERKYGQKKQPERKRSGKDGNQQQLQHHQTNGTTVEMVRVSGCEPGSEPGTGTTGPGSPTKSSTSGGTALTAGTEHDAHSDSGYHFEEEAEKEEEEEPTTVPYTHLGEEGHGQRHPTTRHSIVCSTTTDGSQRRSPTPHKQGFDEVVLAEGAVAGTGAPPVKHSGTTNSEGSFLTVSDPRVLWNVDGEIIKGDYFSLTPLCQFLRFYAKQQ